MLLWYLSCVNADRPEERNEYYNIQDLFGASFFTDASICLCDFSPVPSSCPPLGGNQMHLLGLVPGSVLMCKCVGQFSCRGPIAENFGTLHGVLPVLNPGHQRGICIELLGMVQCGRKGCPLSWESANVFLQSFLDLKLPRTRLSSAFAQCHLSYAHGYPPPPPPLPSPQAGSAPFPALPPQRQCDIDPGNPSL